MFNGIIPPQHCGESLGYVGNNQNAFNIINPSATADDMDDNDATTILQTAAAATTGSTLGNTYAASAASTTFPAEVTTAIQQLAANQMSIMQQFVAFTVNPHTAHRNNLHVPPVHNIHVPAQQAGGYQQQLGGFQQGCGRRRGGGHSWGGGQGGGHGGCVCTTYATGGVPQFVPQFGGTQQGFMPVANTGGVTLPVDMPLPEEDNTAQSTPTKINSTTTGTCVTLMALMSRMVTRQQCVNGGRWTTRRASRATTRRATLTWDMLLL